MAEIADRSSGKIIQAVQLTKSFQQGTTQLKILRSINFEIAAGEAVCILGSSGAGKSTLLHILGTLDRPDQGQLFFSGQNLLEMKDENLSKFRSEHMGFVFQFHHLITEFSALENVLIPCRIAGDDLPSSRAKAMELLYFLGLGERMNHFPNELSGGELQRVAIARALIRKPQILFADEPTGNLDSVTSQRIQDLFFQLKERLKLTLIVVTHDLHFASRFSKVYKMKDGEWVS